MEEHDVTSKQIRICSLFVLDNVYMNDRRVVEVADWMFQNIRKDPRSFGVMTMIYSSNWRQILPESIMEDVLRL